MLRQRRRPIIRGPEKRNVLSAEFTTRARARFAVAEYIEVFYNRQRLHSSLGYRPLPKHSPTTKPRQQPDQHHQEELSKILDTAQPDFIAEWHHRRGTGLQCGCAAIVRGRQRGTRRGETFRKRQ
jgi:Integrase core domain